MLPCRTRQSDLEGRPGLVSSAWCFPYFCMICRTKSSRKSFSDTARQSESTARWLYSMNEFTTATSIIYGNTTSSNTLPSSSRRYGKRETVWFIDSAHILIAPFNGSGSWHFYCFSPTSIRIRNIAAHFLVTLVPWVSS